MISDDGGDGLSVITAAGGYKPVDSLFGATMPKLSSLDHYLTFQHIHTLTHLLFEPMTVFLLYKYVSRYKKGNIHIDRVSVLWLCGQNL